SSHCPGTTGKMSRKCIRYRNGATMLGGLGHLYQRTAREDQGNRNALSQGKEALIVILDSMTGRCQNKLVIL
ncbi:MAG: hypothetical protein P5702_19970, partial [Limnospira sp. PMC 1291.21]